MLDKKFNFMEAEKKWQKFWQDENVYAFDAKSDKKVYSIDTPPPTVNGKIHMGHLSSYIHIDTIARYQRMSGKNVFFPFGYDDNGLPTERYVEKTIGKKAYEMPREEFCKKCLEITAELEKEFHALYISAGFSCNLTDTYSSIDARAQRISQLSFLDLAKKKKAYYAEAPTLWCTECRCAVAQSEIDSESLPSTFNFIKFYIEGEDKFVEVATTRPEMLCACVCVFIHPDDEKNRHLLQKRLKVPGYDFSVPVYTDELVDLEKGSGVVMCCTFGDVTDKAWQKKHNLPIKEAFDIGGIMTSIAGEFAGMHLTRARKVILEKLKDLDLLVKQEAIEHIVATHERCGTPIEIAVKSQWFIDVISIIDDMVKAGYDLKWHPKTMQSRFVNWCEGYAWNWCISRQRYFGVSIPVWYCADCGEIILAEESQLPVNTLTEKPLRPCPKCGSEKFKPETDVFDTWQTSSLTPQICLSVLTGQTGFEELFNQKADNFNYRMASSLIPMDLRPNAHDNIRVWDFYTVVKSLLHFGKLPWTDLMISGYVTSPDGTKLGKSKANSKSTPQDILKEHSADITRYWADSMAAGKDTAFNLENFASGQKLSHKIWNAAKFCLNFLYGWSPKGKEKVNLYPMDAWIIEKMQATFDSYDRALARYDIAFSMAEVEKLFWNFCDNYIEIAKRRLYNPDVFGEAAKESAQIATYTVLLGMMKMFSIYMPHITEEIYQEYFREQEGSISIHCSGYPVNQGKGKAEVITGGDEVVEIVSRIRGFKSENNLALNSELAKVSVTCTTDFALLAREDIKLVGGIIDMDITKGNELKVVISN